MRFLQFLSNFQFSTNFLMKHYRYIGPKKDYYDGPIYCFGFWWFHITFMDGEGSSFWACYNNNKKLESVILELCMLDKKNKALILLHPDQEIRDIIKLLKEDK